MLSHEHTNDGFACVVSAASGVRYVQAFTMYGEKKKHGIQNIFGDISSVLDIRRKKKSK